ncbi:hypothetical protein WIS52_02000 [Pseudonocardia nematodicida]|uniref:Uncharacterized protein n=1 Tax=Pseudonocardia nematodicida TaxID=1206997 RepID=A0ABV1K449_9PSEU
MSGHEDGRTAGRFPRHRPGTVLLAACGVCAVLAAVTVLLVPGAAPGPAPSAGQTGHGAPGTPPPARTAPLLAVPVTGAPAEAVTDAAAAVKARSAATGVCDLAEPPRFDDPGNPDRITNRDCGTVDDQGRLRSHDPWIDDQLLAAQGG